MVPDDYDAADSEYYYEGSLAVLAGRFRRKLVGYFNGNIPPGTRIGREIRLVKLPQLTWVYGYLIRDPEHGVVLYVPNGALLPGVEGFHPLRSSREIRQASPVTSNQPPQYPKSTDTQASDLDDNLDHLTDLMEIEGIDDLNHH
jgi:hypothetical protein